MTGCPLHHELTKAHAKTFGEIEENFGTHAPPHWNYGAYRLRTISRNRSQHAGH
jgi:hypothetical protein